MKLRIIRNLNVNNKMNIFKEIKLHYNFDKKICS